MLQSLHRMGIRTYQGYLKSEIDLEILIIWVSSNAKEPNFFKRADKMYDEIERISSHEEIIIPKKISDINEGIDKNKTMLPISMEGGEGLENDINNLYHFIERGLFYFGPTWNHSLIGFHQIMMRHTICQNLKAMA